MAQLFPPDCAEMPIKVTHQNPGLEYDENMVCEDFLNMGMLPLDQWYNNIYIYTNVVLLGHSYGISNFRCTSKT